MKKISLKELALPLIKSIDSFHYLLKSHHRRVAIISYYLGQRIGLDQKQMIDLIIAAALHDIGALSIQEKDMLIKEDVESPEPHCIMGYRMLSGFSKFSDIAQIIRYHHVNYDDLDRMNERIPIQSQIIHLADRVDISISQDKFILNQKNEVVSKIIRKKGVLFNPVVCDALIEVSKADIFWIEIINMSMEQLFNKVNFSLYHDLNREQMIEFSLVVSRIIDFRSRFTASHSFTVGQLAYKIGEVLGCDKDQCVKLLISGYFHDIGKIGIDTGYIEKNGPLTEEEFNHIKLHPYYTGKILFDLSCSEWFRDVIDWATYHHEKIDGSGYPYALKGDEIKPETKILAFSDIISALMEDRPYRKGMSSDDAFKLINDNIATTIDQTMFESISRYKDKIDTIVRKCRKKSIEVYARSHYEDS